MVVVEPPGPLSLVVVDDSEVFCVLSAGAAAAAPVAPVAPGGPCWHPTIAVPNRNARLINAAAVPICLFIIISPSGSWTSEGYDISTNGRMDVRNAVGRYWDNQTRRFVAGRASSLSFASAYVRFRLRDRRSGRLPGIHPGLRPTAENQPAVSSLRPATFKAFRFAPFRS